ncbi:MAG TPA: hypothetical protein VEK78_09125, partial [Gemmatimonadales bacterium]|nr:hypothetical protein [Gemmatimonadales bacterium]
WPESGRPFTLHAVMRLAPNITADRGSAGASALASTAPLPPGATASATAWAVFYGILLKPLPFAEPDRLVTLGEQYPGVPMGPRGGVLSNIAYHVWTNAGRSRIGPIALYWT